MKKLLSIILTIAIIICAVPFGAFTFTVSAEAENTDEETFIHLTEVPDGYVGIYTKQDLNNIRNGGIM